MNELIWPGSGSAIYPTASLDGLTTYGFYDTDPQFQQDAPKVAKWCANRLGYPIQNVELIDENFYACFEDAINEYGAQVNQFNIRNNLDILKGQANSQNFQGKNVQGTFLPNLIEISDSYGTLVGVGGDTDIKSGSIELQSGKQAYDLKEFASASEGGKKIDITKVYYEPTPAINRFFDPYSISGQGTLNLIDEFGFGSFSPAAQFVLMPLYEDLLRIQAIEFNDQFRKSAHSFNIVNDKLKIFPIPTSNENLWFEYMVRDEFAQNATHVSETTGSVSDYSDINYDIIPYQNVNSVGKQWIRKYTLANAKETLGAIREKYSTVPIPDAEISLDGAQLRAEGQQEKDILMQQLRENLEELSRRSQFEQKSAESDQTQDMLRKVPNLIYIG